MGFPLNAGEDFATWRRREFPIFEHKTFLTHASVVPLPARAATAIQDYAGRIAREGQFDFVHEAMYRRCKERLAKLIGHGAKPEEIAFAGSTSHAIGLVATSLPWQPGDNCVVADGDFPANVVTWKNLEHTHGVEVRMVPFRPEMNFGVEDVAALVDEKTRIVSLSCVHFLTGYTLDLAAIGRYLRERGILLCVDGIQMLGATPVDISEADFLCADAHKWLLGPNGIAVLWVRESILKQLRPAILGWLATEERDDWFQYGTTPRANADCFEPGARNYLGVAGLEASLALFEDMGHDFVAGRVTSLRDYAAQKLEAAGCELLWRPQPGHRAGIVTFFKPGVDMTALYKRLDQDFALAIRQDRSGQTVIRVSAHFMNTEDDLDRLSEAIMDFEAG